jgi:hypothetical protein
MNLDYINALVYATLAAQFVAMLVAFTAFLKLRTPALRWVALYVTIEFCRSSIGSIMAHYSIQNHQFYHYSGLLTQVSFFIFSQSILKNQKRRRFTQWAYGLTFTAFLLLEVFYLPLSVRTVFSFTSIFEMVACITILNDRVYHHEGKRFKKDPWSIIAMAIALTQSLSLICLISYYLFTSHGLRGPIMIVFLSVNIISVFVRNSIITNQLWKLRTST